MPDKHVGVPTHQGAGLYLHVPFCTRVCPYCDFAVRTGSARRQARFVDHLIDEMEHYAEWTRVIDTVYVGGGTPSSLDPEQLARVLERANRQLPVHADAFYTLEANPEDVGADSAAAWRDLGFDGINLGTQSFDDAELTFLGRSHTAAESARSVEVALDAGFESVSVDLIFGLPDQSADTWRANLERAVALQPGHVSCYQLTLHKGTPLHRRWRRGELHELPDAEQAELYLLAHEILADAGYLAYEVSNFARAPRYESRHNRKYWDHTPYLGLGPSAHSFNGERSRWWNVRQLNDWEAAIGRGERPLAGSERLRHEDLALEAVMLGLRTRAGLDCDAVQERWKTDVWTPNEDTFAGFAADGLVRVSGRCVQPTPRGMALADHLARTVTILPA
ncbi:MAG TPA: radical SAM family heme chaperone HemW [Acidobacteriota bacterium]|nr:radical SAM family heme chaperone HemW [Acidobacteriota bacterium]